MALPAKNIRTDEEVSDFMNKVRKRFKLAADAESAIRADAQRDQNFVFGDQWDPLAKQIRDDDKRPCLTINRIPQFLHQVTNTQRQMRPSIVVNPEGGPQSLDNEKLRMYADIWQGLIRHIEVRSDAESAYDTAFESQVGISFGWWRIVTEYTSADSFDQDIRIKRILDPFSVYIDPSAKEPDRSDMQWAFVTSKMSKDEFRRQFPGAKEVNANFYSDFDTGPDGQWVTDDEVQIAEYYEMEFKKRKLQLLEVPVEGLDALLSLFGRDKVAKSNGEGYLELTVFEDEYEKGQLPEGTIVLHERTSDFPQITWYKVSGYDILDETPWPGKWIPLVPCYGTEVVIKGKKQIVSLTRAIRDSQVLFNFFRSQQAEVIALTPKAPFIGPTGTFKTHRAMWQQANNVNYPYLEYDPVILPNGQVAHPPQRNTAEPPIMAINEATREANEDLYAGTGIYPPALGKPSNETSGIAIRQRQQESDTSNFHFIDNFRRGIRHTGQILMDLIPHIYDRRERIIQIIKPDNAVEMVMINGPTEYKGQPVFFDPSVGKYDVDIQVGPNFPTKMEMVFQMLTEMATANPQLLQIAGDLIMRSAPLPGTLANDIADRIKATLPPEIQAIANGDKPEDPVMAGQLMQASQMINMLVQEVQRLEDTIKTKRMELESKERIANIQESVKLITAELKANVESGKHLTQQEYDSIRHRLELLHNSMSLEAEERMAQAELDQQAELQKQQMNQQKKAGEAGKK